MLIMIAALAPFLALGAAFFALDQVTARRKRALKARHLEQQAARKEQQLEISRRRSEA